MSALRLDDDHGATRGLDLLARGGGELVRMDGQRLAEIALGQDLDVDALARAQALLLQGLERDLGARLEAVLEVGEVDRLGVRPERLERHRHLLRRAAELAHLHVDRHLAALRAEARLRARSGARALLATARGLAAVGALAAPDALARLARTRSGLQRVQPDALLGLVLLS